MLPPVAFYSLKWKVTMHAIRDRYKFSFKIAFAYHHINDKEDIHTNNRNGNYPHYDAPDTIKKIHMYINTQKVIAQKVITI